MVLNAQWKCVYKKQRKCVIKITNIFFLQLFFSWLVIVFFSIHSFKERASLVAPDSKESACKPWVRKIPWRREWQPTPVFFPGKFHGQKSLVGYSPWHHKGSNTTERLTFQAKKFKRISTHFIVHLYVVHVLHMYNINCTYIILYI